jgi:hypothetical protein
VRKLNTNKLVIPLRVRFIAEYDKESTIARIVIRIETAISTFKTCKLYGKYCLIMYCDDSYCC